MKIAMFGGSFDPVHNDHVALCEAMINKFALDKVVVFPAACSPFKAGTQTEGFHRLNMCKLAFEAINRVEVSDFEIRKGGKSYTVDTLMFLNEKYNSSELFLITGSDAFLTLSTWYQSDEIFRLAHILAMVRGSDDINALKSKAEEYETLNARCTLVSTPVGSISSTTVRNAIKHNEDVSAYLPQDVFSYIKKNGLYNYGY